MALLYTETTTLNEFRCQNAYSAILLGFAVLRNAAVTA